MTTTRLAASVNAGPAEEVADLVVVPAGVALDDLLGLVAAGPARSGGEDEPDGGRLLGVPEPQDGAGVQRSARRGRR